MKRISASYVYTGKDIKPIVDGYVDYADDGTIISVGELSGTDSPGDRYEGIIAPGFVNAHCHLELSHLRGAFEKGTGMSGFINQINSLRDSKSREEKIRDASAWLERLWNQGVSAMADISNCDDTFAMKSKSPLYTRTFLEVFGTEPEDCEAVIDGVRKLKAEADSYGIDAAPTPHACYTMSPQLLTAASAEALKSGFLSYHSQESPEEEELVISGTGALAENYKGRHLSTPPVTGRPALMYFLDRLSEIHMPPFDEHILLVHNVCLTHEAAEAATSALKNVYWAVCPLSNLFIHNALPPLDLMRKNKLKIAIGTDSLSSNDTLDMVAEMYCISENFPNIPLGEIISWATSSGATFLKKAQLGEIAPGKKPGLVLIENIDGNGRLTADSCSKRII